MYITMLPGGLRIFLSLDVSAEKRTATQGRDWLPFSRSRNDMFNGFYQWVRTENSITEIMKSQWKPRAIILKEVLY